MLNISPNSVSEEVKTDRYEAFRIIGSRSKTKSLLRFLSIFSLAVLLILFLPWTQNIRSTGKVTTLQPGQRPQSIQSTIDGRIETWFVREGDYVSRGDTILFISEIKDAYFDPELLERVQVQKEAKQNAADSYSAKASALARQLEALKQSREVKLNQGRNKLQQARFKLQSDSIDLQAAEASFDIAEAQLKRMEELFTQGLKSQTDLEKRRLKVQETRAKLIAQQNKLAVSRNEVDNLILQLTNLEAEFADKIAKAESERFSALSSEFDAMGSLSKLENQYVNYERRNQLYYITAPQNGYITQALKVGIGENIKAGEEIVTIMPAEYDLAVETYIRPMDLPLLQKGQKVRIQFDGWPAVVFAGWPDASIGTFGGKVFAIDNFANQNGLFRILVAPDDDEADWPEAIRVGTGVQTMALLNDVPIWYELWRQINGFPPNFYQSTEKEKLPKDRKPKYK
ncbi:MAG: HlyD family efflux transporter periplasmic adaptor subunit [Bacteroidetes bacterium]|nr:HlyD family efflux transporter periplasmic adaptor subunit [Bacteroidota bacterium]